MVPRGGRHLPPGCLVVVTSRNTLTGLIARDRANRTCLDVLPLTDAVSLLGGFVGPAMVTAELGAARAQPRQARAWLDTERLNLLAATAHGARHGWSSHARDLAATLSRYPRR